MHLIRVQIKTLISTGADNVRTIARLVDLYAFYFFCCLRLHVFVYYYRLYYSMCPRATVFARLVHVRTM